MIAAAPARVKRIDDRSRCAACTQHAHAAARDVDTLSRQRRDEAGTVGAVALQSAVADRYDGVDASQCRCSRIELVDEVGDGFLVRHRDRQAAEAEARASRPAPRPLLPGSTSNAVYTQSTPVAANPALCSAGDRL